MHPETESRQLELSQAEQTLVAALEEACRVNFGPHDIAKADTGELIRIDEALATASRAAKDAVSKRLRTDRAREQAGESRSAEPQSAEPPAGSGSNTSGTHRFFDDAQGNRWHAFAVQSSSGIAERRALPDAYRQGWLVFELGDEVRRLAPVPENWERLSVEALRDLCQRAPASKRRKAPPTDATDSDRLVT